MECKQCGHTIQGKALFCPNCGHKLESTQQASPRPNVEAERTRPTGEKVQRQGCGLSLIVVAIAAFVVLGIVGLGAAGVYYGMSDRAKMERRAAVEHHSKGLAHMAQDELELAIAEFELVLQLNPEHEEALTKLAQARQRLEVEPTATPALLQETNAAYLDELRVAFQTQDWQGVFELADRLIAADPTYHRDEVDQMLVDAFYNSGLQMVEEDRMKEAVRFFERALTLHPGDERAIRAKELATLYLAGMAYWNADWDKTIESLAALYRLDPDYKDVRQRTHDAHLSYGDLLMTGENWCEAEKQYAQALDIIASSALSAKQQDALDRCHEQSELPPSEETPTPEETIPPTPAGTFVGHVVEKTGIDKGKMYIRGKVLDSSGEGVQNIRVQIRAWDWTAVAVTDGDGQYAFDGLSNPVTYTLTLLDVPCSPFDVAGEWTKITWVDFQETQ